jgi:uncharacterized protein
MSAQDPPVESPCIKVCVLDEVRGYCIGCGRSLGEIAAWSSATEEEKREIVARAAARKAP